MEDNNMMNANALDEEFADLLAAADTDVPETAPAAEDPFESDVLDLEGPDDGEVLVEVEPGEAVAAVEEAASIAADRRQSASAEAPARASIFDTTGDKVSGTFRDSSAHVTPMGSSLGYDTFQMELRSDLDALRQAALSYSKRTRTGQVMTGRVGRITERDNRVCAWVKYGYVDVLIPHEMFTDWGPNETTNTIRRRMRQYLGAEVQYYVRHIDMEHAIAVGDRISVLRHELLVNWLTPDRRTGEYLVQQGQEYEGVIDRVASTHLTVTVKGYSADIPVEDVLWGYTANLRDYRYAGRDELAFVPGKHIGVYIEEAERTQADNGRVGLRAKLSIKQTSSSRARREHAFSHYAPHRDVETCIVEGYSRRNGSVHVRTFHDGLPIICKPVKEFTPPARGSRVRVRVTHVDKENYRLFGDILFVEN